MNDFLWHEVSVKEKKDISKQAKNIMDSFSNTLKGTRKLSKIDSKKLKEVVIERDECEREEDVNSEKQKIDTLKGTSRDIMFENAPNTLSPKGDKKGTSKNNDFIIAEKKGW